VIQLNPVTINEKSRNQPSGRPITGEHRSSADSDQYNTE